MTEEISICNKTDNKFGDILWLGVKAWWLIPFVDKCVGGMSVLSLFNMSYLSALKMSITLTIRCYTDVPFTLTYAADQKTLH